MKTLSLSDLLTESAIEVDLKGKDKSEILGELCALIVKAGVPLEGPALLAAVEAREKLGSTGCGDGVAVPHARIAGLERTALALGLSKQGIDFGGVDSEPARIFFLLLGSQNEPEAYLKTLSQIAKLIKDEEFRASLLACPDAKAAAELIKAGSA